MSLGAVVTPETLKGLATCPLSVLCWPMSTLCMIATTSFYLRFVHGWDCAYRRCPGASPGRDGPGVALAAEFKADLRGIAIVQIMRVVLVTIGLPGGLALFGWRAAA